MKTVTTNTIAPATVSLVNESKDTVIRSADILARDVLDIAEDGRVTIRKGADVSASELALFIVDREQTGARFKTQARWTYYAAGLQPNGSDLQQQIAKRLREMLTPSAFHQLKSEANNIAPLIVAEGIKSPLSVMKDAMGELKVKPNGMLAPMKDQSKAARELIPLLKAGTATQAKVREVRAKYTTATTNPTNPKVANPTAKPDDAAKMAAVAYGNAIGGLNTVAKYLDGNRVEGKERDAFVNLVTELGRKLGLTVSVPNAPAPTAPAKK